MTVKGSQCRAALFHASEGHHIDALRAILPPLTTRVVFDQGHYGVAIFFALSGFVIAHSLRDIVPRAGFFGRFVLRRAIRLDPPYWASIPIVFAFGLLSARVQGHTLAWPSLGAVVAHLFYLQVLLHYPSINTVYWTLTYEVQFYIFLAGVLVAARAPSTRSAWAGRAAWGLMFFLACAAAIGLTSRVPEGLFIDLWPAFFVGVLAYRAPNNRVAPIGLAVLALLMLAWPTLDGAFARYSAVTALLLFAALATGRIRTALNWRWLQFIGGISYSLYLLHNPISGAVGFLSRKLWGVGPAPDAATLCFIMAASVIGAWVYWLVVERAAHQLSRRVKLQPAIATY